MNFSLIFLKYLKNSYSHKSETNNLCDFNIAFFANFFLCEVKEIIVFVHKKWVQTHKKGVFPHKKDFFINIYCNLADQLYFADKTVFDKNEGIKRKLILEEYLPVAKK